MASQVQLPRPPGWVQSILGGIGSIGAGGAPNQTTIQGSIGAANTVSDVTGFLTNSSVWVRLGEIVSGLILMFVGLRTMFPAQVNVLTSTAKNAAKAAGAAALI